MENENMTVGKTVFGPVTWGDGKTQGKVVAGKDLLHKNFVVWFNDMQASVHETAVDRGWWELRRQMECVCAMANPRLGKFAEDTSNASLIALFHSELSEALENSRAGSPPDDKVPEFSGVEVELADCIIRIMDASAERGWRVAEALVAKLEMNKSRPKMHGKGF